MQGTHPYVHKRIAAFQCQLVSHGARMAYLVKRLGAGEEFAYPAPGLLAMRMDRVAVHLARCVPSDRFRPTHPTDSRISLHREQIRSLEGIEVRKLTRKLISAPSLMRPRAIHDERERRLERLAHRLRQGESGGVRRA